MRTLGTVAFALGLLAAMPAQAQQTSGCATAKADPATTPAPAGADGTAPGNAGSTGWTGGLGGSTIGTSQNGATPASPSFQPATAHGLDPIATPPKPAPSAC